MYIPCVYRLLSNLFSVTNDLPLLFPTHWNFGVVSSPNVNDHLMRQCRACVVEYLGLGITDIAVLCVQAIPTLSPLLFMPSLYSTL